MARFTCNIDLDNAAFDDADELPNILRSLADEVNPDCRAPDGDIIQDINGNTIGRWEVVE